MGERGVGAAVAIVTIIIIAAVAAGVYYMAKGPKEAAPGLSIDASADPATGYAPLQVDFTASATGGAEPYGYAWDFGDGENSPSQNPTHAYDNAGTHSATVTVTDNEGNTASDSVVINVFDVEAVATVTEVKDGDTVDVNITDILDPHQGIYEGHDTIRFAGVDAWEMSESGGPEAKDFIENLCPVVTKIYMDIDDRAQGHGPCYEPYRGNYGRIIAVIYVKVDSNWVNLNAQLVRENHGKAITWFSSEFNPHDWLSGDYPYVLT